MATDQLVTVKVPASVLRMVPLEEIQVSKTNPRKRFDDVALEELKASIREKGLVSPLLVRPIEANPRPGAPPANFELVAGERRFRCCTALGTDLVPCLVRALTDTQALELQIIENLQRDDLDPIEEAEGYEKLIEMGECTPKEVAGKVNKSANYIYQRLKLLFLPELGRQALLDGRLGIGHARQIGSLPHEDWRLEATKIVLNPKGCKVPDLQNNYWNHPEGEALTATQTTELLISRYMRELKTAPFDQKDPLLNPDQGPCTTCPRRAGNSPELFPHLRADMCTDLKCYEVKKEAVRLKLVEEAKAKGQRVLTEAERQKVMYEHSGTNGVSRMNHDSPYVKLDEQPSWGELDNSLSKVPAWRSLVKGKEVPVILTVDPSGKVHELVEHKLALTAAKENRPELFKKRGSSSGSAADKKAADKRKLEQAIAAEVFTDVMDALAVKIEKTEKVGDVFAEAFLAYAVDLINESYCSSDEGIIARVLRRRRFQYAGDDEEKAVKTYTKSLGVPSAKLALALELLLTRDESECEGSGNIIFGNAYKIDRKKIEEAVKVKVAARVKTEAEAKKKPDKNASFRAYTHTIGHENNRISGVLDDAGVEGMEIADIAKATKLDSKLVAKWFVRESKLPGWGLVKLGPTRWGKTKAALDKMLAERAENSARYKATDDLKKAARAVKTAGKAASK